MPTYRITATVGEVTLVFDAFAYGEVTVCIGQSPETLQGVADKLHRNDVVVNVPAGATSCKVEPLTERKKPRPPLTSEEELVLELLRTRKAHALSAPHLTPTRARLSRKGLILYNPVEGWCFTTDGRRLAFALAAERLRAAEKKAAP